MKKLTAMLLALVILAGTVSVALADYDVWNQYTEYAWVSGKLNRRLATRTGPGTQYDEAGSYFGAGTNVTILSKAYDDRNKIWWVQTEFTYKKQKLRAYTGVKRFDGLNLNRIPEERAIGSCYISQSTECFYGPSADEYKQMSRNVPSGVYCTIYGYAAGGASDYIQIEFYDSGAGQDRRAWVADWSVDDFELWN